MNDDFMWNPQNTAEEVKSLCGSNVGICPFNENNGKLFDLA